MVIAVVLGLIALIVAFFVWTARSNRLLLEFANAAALRYIITANPIAKQLVIVAMETVTGDKMTGELLSILVYAKLAATGQADSPEKAASVARAEELEKLMFSAQSTLASSIEAKKHLPREAMDAWRRFDIAYVKSLPAVSASVSAKP